MRIFLLLLSLFLGSPLAQAENTPATIPLIPVTRTWDALAGTKSVTFSKLPAGGILIAQAATKETPAFRVWIGADRDHASRNGAILLYCLAEGMTFSPRTSKSLGPFEVHVKKPQAEQEIADLICMAIPQQQNAAYFLYTKVVPVQGPGDYIIELAEPDSDAVSPPGPKVFSRLKVAVTKTPAAPWSPWNYPVNAQAVELVESPDEPFAQAQVSNPEGGLALPTIGDEGLPLIKLPPATTPLPVLLPDKPDPGIHLSLNGKILKLTFAQEIDDDSPEDHFLTRWWINGKLFIPDPTKIMAQQARAEARLSRSVQEVRFDLEFHPERLGAKKGDRVGLQLLYCPDGWEYTGEQLKEAKAQLAQALKGNDSSPPPNFSLLSNRIDFLYSGDPTTPQQAGH